MNKLVVPFLTLALATFGCSSSTTSTPGTGGSGGASATGGSGGKGGGGAGTSGGAGTTGGAGTSGAAGTTGGGGAKADAAVSMADCTTTTAGSTAVLTPAVFCQNLIDFCGPGSGFTLPTAYATESQCVQTFMDRSASLQACQSYHLCWGVEGLTNVSGPNPPVHCVHATGMALCVPDGSTGN